MDYNLIIFFIMKDMHELEEEKIGTHAFYRFYLDLVHIFLNKNISILNSLFIPTPIHNETVYDKIT